MLIPPERSLEGKILLADPSLNQGDFQKSVILMAEHTDDGGSYGLILNRPLGKRVRHYLKDEKFEPLERVPVHFGGPVARDQLTFALLWEDQGDLRFAVRVSAEDAIQALRSGQTQVRAFVGHSGWDGGQLQNELREKSWLVVPPDGALVREKFDRALWSKMLRTLSPYYRIIAEAPDDPFLN